MNTAAAATIVFARVSPEQKARIVGLLRLDVRARQEAVGHDEAASSGSSSVRSGSTTVDMALSLGVPPLVRRVA